MATWVVLVTTVTILMWGPDCSQAQGMQDIIPALVQQLTSLWQSNELEFMGSPCLYFQTPKIKKFELYFRGRFTCPSWTAIRGEAETRSRSGVMAQTIEDFLIKAQAAHLVTVEEARTWLQGFA